MIAKSFSEAIEEKFEIYLLAPEDLIISKISRFTQNDEDVSKQE